MEKNSNITSEEVHKKNHRYQRTYFNKNKIPSAQPKNKSHYKVAKIKWEAYQHRNKLID